VCIPTRSKLSRVARGRYPLGVIALASTIALLAVLALHTSSGASAAIKAHATQPKARFPAFHDAVPVLLYHRLRPQSGFDAQMRRLHDLGFEAITLDQYMRFVRGKTAGLPQRPILITFDDGYPSAWKNADPVLARYGWSAVMYVPTGYVGHPGFLSWDELRQMRSSRRWQIDEHAGNGHVLITADAAGTQLPFYAAELWQDGRQESFAHYKRRVRRDIDFGSTSLARNLPGWTPPGTFAVPFGDYGQRASNDPRIGPWLARYLASRFDVVFVQRDDSFTKPGQNFVNRIGVPLSWNADVLQEHLLRGLAH
jgi:biofilm PGA synthesis lipoprotein PgaB